RHQRHAAGRAAIDPRGEPRDRIVQRRVRRGERLGAGVRVGAKLVAREARDREGIHSAGSAARAAATCDQGGTVKALLVLLVPAIAFAKKPPEPPVGGPSRAVTPEILKAIDEEMNRALTELQIEG